MKSLLFFYGGPGIGSWDDFDSSPPLPAAVLPAPDVVLLPSPVLIAPPPSPSPPPILDLSIDDFNPAPISPINSDTDLLAPLSEIDLSGIPNPIDVDPILTPPSSPDLEWTEIKVDE